MDINNGELPNLEFDTIQSKLAPLWRSIKALNDDEQTIVVVPSLTVDYPLEGALLQAYEERFLFLLFLLRQPRARLIYVTSQQIHPLIVDYYLHLLPGVIASHARKRLFLVTPLDGSPQPLTRKLLDRPRLLAHIRSLIVDLDRAHMVPFNTTELERDLAVTLRIPMYAADPKHFHFGTKTGGRRVFIEEVVSCPDGIENISSLETLIDAVIVLKTRQPTIDKILVKLNEGVSGDGNATVDLGHMVLTGSDVDREVVECQVRSMVFEAAGTSFDDYINRLQAHHGVVEEAITGRHFESPSVQMRITPLGDVEVLSTHDQILGGVGGQTYMGCRFPADDGYAALITAEARKIGDRLMDEGVLGRFAVDFVVVRNHDTPWKAYAIEINLRKGGTTHPFLTLQFLTDGTYDPECARFTEPGGKEKFFVATDAVKSESYRLFTPEDIFDIVARHRLHFDQSRQVGIVLHMISAVGELGRFGMTAVGDSPAHAQEIYDRAVTVFCSEAERCRELS